MRRPRITSQRVAELAGVSQTTVSFVLNHVDSANISEETKQRVFEAARSIGYVPDAAARTLARGRSSNIGFILHQPHEQVFIDEYMPRIITGLSQICRQHGYRILVELVADSSHPNTYLDLIRGKEVAGVIVNFNSASDHDIEALVASVAEGAPVVALNEYDEALYYTAVDKLEGVKQAVEHLIGLGHKRIACINYAPVPNHRESTRRFHVYRETLIKAGLVFDEALVRNGNYDPETGYEAMQSILKEPVLPTALFAMNDVMAFGAIRAIQEAGLHVPHDIAVVGFDDIRLAPFSTPPLTTVREPDIEHGWTAGKMLIDLISNKSLKQNHIMLKTELKIRDSCGFRLQQGIIL